MPDASLAKEVNSPVTMFKSGEGSPVQLDDKADRMGRREAAPASEFYRPSVPGVVVEPTPELEVLEVEQEPEPEPEPKTQPKIAKD